MSELWHAPDGASLVAARALHFGAAVKAAAKTRIDPKDLPAVEAATLRRIARYVRPHSFRICIVAASIFLAAVLNLIPSWAVKRVIDDAIPQRNLMLLLSWCAAMTVAPLAAGLLQVVQKHTAETIGQDVMLELRVALYEHLQQMPFAFFQTQRPGEAVSHVLNDVQGAGSVVGSTLLGVAQNAIGLVLTLAFVIALDWRLALVASAFLPLFITPTRRVGRKRKAIKRDVQSRMAEMTSMLTETLSVSGALLVKIFGREKAEVERFQEKALELRRLSLEQSLAGRWFQMMLGLFESVGPALVFAAGGLLVIKGRLPLGTIVAFVTLLKRIYSPASDLAGVHVDLLTSYAYFDRVFDVLDRPGSIRDVTGAIALDRPKGRIEFNDVSFAYGGAGWALRGVNLRVPPGSTIAIVGPSGAGKSTIGSLVARLYDPTEGTLSIDGIDLRDMTATSLRAAVAVVSQETFLFHGSVIDNLKYGSPHAWRSDVERVAKLAQIHDVISALPDGYDTVVGARGHRFSGGERQRLAIARAILTEPRIIVFDEATSALDNASERRVQDALACALKGRTTLIIAHRLSTVRNADSIVVLDGGRIVERGTHDELLARAGLYAWLWNVQARETAYEQMRHLGPDAWSPPLEQVGVRWRSGR